MAIASIKVKMRIGFQEDKDMAKEAGMNDFLSKPLEIDLLYTVIQKWLTVFNTNL